MGFSTALCLSVFCLWFTGTVISKNPFAKKKLFTSIVTSTTVSSVNPTVADINYTKDVTDAVEPEVKHSASVGNTIRGLLVFVFPPVAFLIYKCCSIQSTR